MIGIYILILTAVAYSIYTIYKWCKDATER
jgi:hypothetical protein